MAGVYQWLATSWNNTMMSDWRTGFKNSTVDNRGTYILRGSAQRLSKEQQAQNYKARQHQQLSGFDRQ